MNASERVLLAGCMVAAGLLGGASAALVMRCGGARERVTAREFLVVDEEGRTGIRLRVAPEGPRVALHDEAGQVRAFIGRTQPAAPGKPAHWAMSLTDSNGNPRVLCALQDSGDGASMQVRDAGGAIRYIAAYTGNEGGGLTLRDPQNRKRFAIGMPASAGYSMAFVDENGTTIWSAPGAAAARAATNETKHE